MATFKLAKKDAVSDTRSNIYDLHEKKLEYFESEKRKLPEYISLLQTLKEQSQSRNSESNLYKVFQQIEDLECKIENIQDDYEMNNYLLDFFLTINETDEKYEDQKLKGQMDSFYTSKVNNSKIEVYNSYVRKFNPELKEVCTSKHKDTFICVYCNSETLTFDYKTSCEVCVECGRSNTTLFNEEQVPVYTENIEQVIVFNYDRKNHFQECLNQLQAKENTTIPPHIIRDLATEFKKYNITDPKMFTNSLVQSYLKKLKYNKYYEHIPTIINEFCGLKSPKLTPELEQQLKIMFDEIQAPFEKYSKIVCPLRKNFLNYNYTFYKMCQLLGKDEFLLYFPLLKNRERLYEHDRIWKGICTDLKWEFISSI
jgi:hypothetical protein